MTSTTQADPGVQTATLLEEFFAVKTSRDVEGTMAYFAPDMASYIDATLGWDFDSHAALRAVFEEYMPGWAPPARSYATRIVAGRDSALVHMVDTPELFGGELRILAAVDFEDGKIVRWVDYWDSLSFDTALYEQLRMPADRVPAELRDTRIASLTASGLAAAATDLQRAFADRDPDAAAALMHTDVTFTDMALRTRLTGRLETLRYLEAVLGAAPYGRGSTLRHVVGGEHGGGFEWTADPEWSDLAGITALELDADGLITAITSVYDSRRIEPSERCSLQAASIE